MIKSIDLINWKTHKHTTMHFQKGVNVLVGVMGAGKSSIIDGISFGLFGTFPKLNHKRTTIEDLISNRQEVMDDAEIRVTFTIGNDEYTVSRKINRKDSTASRLERNGNYLQTQTARVNEEIENLIKVDYDTFSRAIYAEQNRLDYFLELTKGDRKRQIDEMLGLDSFAKAEENSTSLINQIKGLINEEEQILARIDRSELKSQLEKLVGERDSLQKENSLLLDIAKEKDALIKSLNLQLSGLKSKSERSNALSKKIAEISSRIDTIKKELAAIESQGIDGQKVKSDYEAKLTAMGELNSYIKKLKNEESSLQKSLSDAEASLKQSQKRVVEREQLLVSAKGKEIGKIEQNANEANDLLQRSVKELSSLKGRKDEIAKQKTELEKHLSKCPICERDLDDSTRKALLGQKDNALAETETTIGKLQKQIEISEKEFIRLKRDLDEIKLTMSRLADYKDVDSLVVKYSDLMETDKGKHDAVRLSLEKQTLGFETINKEINSLTVKLDAVKRKEKYENEIVISSELLESSRAELKSINFDDKNLYALQELITKESSELSESSSKLGGNERYIKGIESQIEERTKNLANVNAIADRIEGRRAHINNMNKFRSALVETEMQLRDSLIRSINSLMLNIWSDIYPYADYSAIRLNAKKDDYSLEAGTGTDSNGMIEWVEMDGMASGGERSTACLAMRIAFAMVIVPNLRWLILDEPTHNIDENGINRFIDMLGNKLPSLVEQIFIITHDSSLKSITSARVYQLERDKDKNEYTSVLEA